MPDEMQEMPGHPERLVDPMGVESESFPGARVHVVTDEMVALDQIERAEANAEREPLELPAIHYEDPDA